MLPVWIYLVAICVVLIVINRPPSLISVVVYALGGAGFIKGGVLGLGHFWYLSIILIAYILTPLLYVFSDRVKRAKTWQFILTSVVCSLVLCSLFFWLGNVSYGVCLSLFVISYYLFLRHDEKWASIGVKKALIPTIFLIIIRILLSILNIETWGYYAIYDALYVSICKSVAGYWLFCGAYCLFSKQKFQVLPKVAEKLSIVSFEIYITHQFIELSVYEFVPYCSSGTVIGAFLMLLISAILIALNTIVLYYFKVIITKGFSRLRK